MMSKYPARAGVFGLTRIPELVEICDERFLRRARSASHRIGDHRLHRDVI
jgi:hypothetical protein